MTAATLDRINEACASSYSQPDECVNGFCLFFRGYLPSAENAYLVGAALAWPEDPAQLEQRGCYAAVAGMDTVQRYDRASRFDLEESKLPGPETARIKGEYFRLYLEAMDRLRKYVSSIK